MRNTCLIDSGNSNNQTSDDPSDSTDKFYQVIKLSNILGTTIRKVCLLLSDSDYYYFLTRTTISYQNHYPRMHGKIHKHGVPLRSILYMVGSFNYSFAKWLNPKLETLRIARSVYCTRFLFPGIP